MAFIHRIRQIQLIGPKIKQLRKEHRLTQTELASRINIQQSDLSRMEKGEYRVSLDTLFRILAEFNLSIGEFFEELDQDNPAAQEAKLMNDIQRLSPEARREVEAFIAFKRTHDSPVTTERQKSNA